MDLFSVPVALAVILVAMLYLYLTRKFNYWKDRGVTFIQPYPLVGSLINIFAQKEHMGIFFGRMAKEHKGEPYVGYFQGSNPGLIVMDPELIKNIMIKDFSHFVDHGFEISEDVDPLQSKNLFNMDGQRWKEMRNKLSPTFTSGKIKSMFPLVDECAKNFQSYMMKHQNENIEIKDLLARFTTDIIASCAFGINVNSVENPNDKFREQGRKIFDIGTIQGIKNACFFFLPKVAEWLRFRFFQEDVSNFFRTLVSDIIGKRLESGNTRKDFMQLLIQLKEKGKLAEPDDEADANDPSSEATNFKLTSDDIVAQALVFFVAGFETSSTSLTYGLMEMARKPSVQKKARENIEEVLKKHNGVMSYQALQDMTYLDLIMQESLRMYPPLAILNRVTTKNYTIPGTKVTLDKGTNIVIPARALQTDSDFYDDPEDFNPDRFADEDANSKNLFLAFGDGPRICIGMRFAKLQYKMALYSILRNLEVLESPKTTYPPEFDPKMFILTSKNDIYVQLKAVST